jgi:hypothetical protein
VFDERVQLRFVERARNIVIFIHGSSRSIT